MSESNVDAAIGSRSSRIVWKQSRSRFFVAAALMMLLVTFLGFAPTFYLRGLVPGANLFPTPLYVYVHGALMTAWYMLFLAQTCLVASGRSDLHQRLGIGGAVLAVAVVFSGACVLINVVARLEAMGMEVAQQVEMLRIDRIVIGGFCTLAVFSGLVASAIFMRGRPSTHRRLMFWAFVLTLGAALNINRMFGAMLAVVLPAWLPLAQLAGLGSLALYDWVEARRVHPATLFGAAACFLVVVLERLISGSEAGRAFILSLAQGRG